MSAAQSHTQSQKIHARGIEVTFIASFRRSDTVILKETSNKLIVYTDDGSYGEKGFTTIFLKQEIEANIAEDKPQFDCVIAVGPDIMMKFLADVIRTYGIKTINSLNPIMMDGTEMCGCCVIVGEIRFACVEGPDFDAHEFDFDSQLKRVAFYKESRTKQPNISVTSREESTMTNLEVNMSMAEKKH